MMDQDIIRPWRVAAAGEIESFDRPAWSSGKIGGALFGAPPLPNGVFSAEPLQGRSQERMTTKLMSGCRAAPRPPISEAQLGEQIRAQLMASRAEFRGEAPA